MPLTSKSFLLTLMTADPAHAAAADAAGVDRIGVDLEVKGKAERQVSRPSWIAGHTMEDLRTVAVVLRSAKLFTRIHPFALGGREELEQVLAAGAQVVMLPMFTTAAQALEFVRAVDGRAVPVLLLETVPAVEQLDDLLRSELDFEIHLGLNDLGISRGHATPFAMLIDPWLRSIGQCVRATSRAFAVGRLGRPTDTSLPVPADLICALTVSLGATASFVSQYFARGIDPANAQEMSREIQALRRRLDYWAQASPEAFEGALRALREAVAKLSAQP